MFSKKHYELVASVFRSTRKRATLLDKFCEEFSRDNPLFNEELFREAATIDLGYMNGWQQQGWQYQITFECADLKHERLIESDHRRCITKVMCPVCCYSYKVDSSD